MNCICQLRPTGCQSAWACACLWLGVLIEELHDSPRDLFLGYGNEHLEYKIRSFFAQRYFRDFKHSALVIKKSIFSLMKIRGIVLSLYQTHSTRVMLFEPLPQWI